MKKPKITLDPRFRGGCKLIQSGRDGAIDIFAMLLEEARTKYGEASIETAPAYFEYGTALFRESQREQERNQAAEGGDEEEAGDDDDEEKKPAMKSESETMVKSETTAVKEEEDDKKPAATENGDKSTDHVDLKEESATVKKEEDEEQEEGDDNDDNTPEEEEEEEDDDVHLALSMMETAYAILDTFLQTSSSSSSAAASDVDYRDWVQRVELPRVLLNLGDVLSFLERHADAADAYTRELSLREENLKSFEEGNTSTNTAAASANSNSTTTNNDGASIQVRLEHLKERRKTVEANVLVATELLACAPGEDVVTTETKACLVSAAERDSYAEGYYQQAREQLQETVLLMAELAGRCEENANTKAEFVKEKENVCFASTLVMGVGEQLAQLTTQQKEEEDAKEPSKKKAKR